MADIPPNIVGSSVQAGYHQADVAKVRDGQRAEQTNAARASARSIDDAGTTIETTDDDTAVFADAEGAGGQGRQAEEESDEGQSDQQESQSQSGISTDGDGQMHVDLQA